MSASNTAHLNLKKLTSPVNAQVKVNEDLVYLDALVQITLKDRDLTAPPASPAEGDSYLVAASPTGDWASQAGKIAVYNTGWTFFTVQEGWVLYILDEDILLNCQGAGVFKQVPIQAAAQVNSVATDVATLVTDFNALLAKLRTSGTLTP